MNFTVTGPGGEKPLVSSDHSRNVYLKKQLENHVKARRQNGSVH